MNTHKVLSHRLAPGQQGLLIIKSLVGFYRNPIQLFASLHEQYGDIVRLQGGPYFAHLITQPDHIKHILQDNAKNYRLSGIFDEIVPVVGKGLTTNNGPSWLRQRRMVQIAFNHKYIPAYGELMLGIIEDRLQGWRSYLAPDQPLNIDDEILKINLQILGKLLFSVDLKNNHDFLAALATVRKVTIERARSLISRPYNQRFHRAVHILDSFTYAQIAERRSGTGHTDILSMLMEATSEETGARMTDTELHDEIMTLFFAAYEDVANATSWTWTLFAQNPHVEACLRAEIDEVIGNRPPAAADLYHLPYLSMTVNEVLRLYPTTWSLLREAINDDEVGGFYIPADSTIIFDLFLTHRLPKYWEHPETFDPEHFSPERSTGRPRFAYFPFGGGPRQCIGNELALMEIKLILIRMIQLYRFELVSKLPIRMNALSSLQPRGGVWVKIKDASG